MQVDKKALELAFKRRGITSEQLRTEYTKIIEDYEAAKSGYDVDDAIEKLHKAVWSLNHYDNPEQRYEIVSEILSGIIRQPQLD